MRNIFIFLLLFLLNIQVYTQDKIIKYNEYLSRIKENLPELKSLNIDLKKADNNIYKSRTINDYHLEGNINYFNDTGYQDYDSLEGINLSAKISKKYLPLGTSIYSVLKYSKTRVEGERQIIQEIVADIPVYKKQEFENNYFSPELEIGFTQPLLYNMKGIIDKYVINNSKYNYEIAKIQLQINKNSILNYYKKLYFNWIARYKNVQLIKNTLKNANKIKELVEDKYNSGLVDLDELERANSLVVSYKKQLLNYQMLLDLLEKELNVIINITNYKPNLNLYDSFFNKACSLCQNDIETPFNKTNNYYIFEKSLEKLGLLKRVNKNKTLPELNIVANMKLKSKENSLNDSINKLNDIDYQFGLSLNLPVNNYQAKGNLIDTKLSIEQLEYELEENKNMYHKQVESILEQIESKRKMIGYIKENIDILNSEYETEESKYEQARLTLQVLLDTENKITNEKINFLTTKNELINLYLDFINITD